MTETALPVPVADPLHAEVVRVWPDPQDRPLHGLSLLAAAGAGAVAATVLPESPPGLGLVVVGLLVAAAAAPPALSRLGPHEAGFGAAATLLLCVAAWRDAPWLAGLCLLVTFAVASYALAPARGVVATLLGGASLAFAPLRSLPWIGRGIAPYVRASRSRGWWPVARTAIATLLLLGVFGALFASADAAFAELVPDVNLDLHDLPARAVIFVVFGVLALATAFLAAVPPRWDTLAPKPARPVRVAEWSVPIGVLVALFAFFVAVQLAVLFGGHRHVLETAGLTYAEYARAGFGQLVAVTVLTLAVVAAAVRWAPRETDRQRALLRGLLGGLCALALVVVASALYRLHLYEEAFGFTRLRLFMNAFETWLGVLVVLVLLAGIRLRAPWLARAAVATGAATLLVLAALNPDGFVADRNVERYQATGKLDVAYLQGLSADAVPAASRLPEPLRSCVLSRLTPEPGDGVAGWNYGRWRARQLLADRPPQNGPGCAAHI